MRLEDIGFYTLSDDRAKHTSTHSPLYRCELILTDRCNFSCPYCRGIGAHGDIDFEDALKTLSLWCDHGLKNVRFSGGEPTLYPWLSELVLYCRKNRVSRIAVSTNGSANLGQYRDLISCGVNDFSISLDGCCASLADKLSGSSGYFEKVVNNIRELSKQTYVTVGIVFTRENIRMATETVTFADSLGVSDIRVIPSAQYNQALSSLGALPDEFLSKYPILKYRIENVRCGKHVRGISWGDTNKCWLMLDDMVVCNGEHFPCIIYLREGGKAIGPVGDTIRKDREKFMCGHRPSNDPICRSNCLDVCIEYNKQASYFYSMRLAREINGPLSRV